jgi:hypothetical protein
LQKPKKLSSFTRTNEERAIANCIENSILIGRKKPNEIEDLIDSIAKWRIYVGLPKDDATFDLVLISNYVYNSFPFLTISEFELAWMLSINNKLEDCTFFGTFSPLYIGKVLNSYLQYRKMVMADTIKRKEAAEFEEKYKINKPSAKEQCDTIRSIIKSQYDNYKKSKEIIDPFNLIYNFLRKHKILKVTQQDIDIAMLYGNNKYDKLENIMVNNIFNISKEEKIKNIARCYLVQKFFENIEIDSFISTIKEEMFQ